MVLIAGLSISCVSAWLLVEEHLYIQGAAPNSSYSVSSLVLLVVGITVTLVAFTGCCGAILQSRCLLGFFATFLLLLVAAEIAFVVLILLKQIDYSTVVSSSLRDTVVHKYHESNSATKHYIDTVQRGLQCCAESGPEDWKLSIMNKLKSQPAPEIGVGATQNLPLDVPYSIPSSCCRDPSNALCQVQIQPGSKPADSLYFLEGCTSKLLDLANDHIMYLFCAGLGLILTETLGAMFSICLCCTIKKIEDMKH